MTNQIECEKNIWLWLVNSYNYAYYDYYRIGFRLHSAKRIMRIRMRSHGMRNCGYVEHLWLVVTSFRRFRLFLLRKFISFVDCINVRARARVCIHVHIKTNFLKLGLNSLSRENCLLQERMVNQCAKGSENCKLLLIVNNW